MSAYDDQIGPKITAWLALAKGCGDAVAAQVPAIAHSRAHGPCSIHPFCFPLWLQAADVQHAFDEHRKILLCASQSAKPADADFGTVLAGLSKAMGDVQVLDRSRAWTASRCIP